MDNKMFCFLCQEAAGCTGCTVKGVCGKTPDLAKMQDLLIYVTRGLSEVATSARAEGIEVSQAINTTVTMNLFTTITNANFDKEVFYGRVKDTLRIKEELLAKLSGCVVEMEDEEVVEMYDIPYLKNEVGMMIADYSSKHIHKTAKTLF